MKKTNALILAGSAVAFAASMSLAQDSKNQGYLVDTYGNSVVTSSNTGLCWRTSDWTPARVVESCDPVARKAEIRESRVVAAVPPSQSAIAPAPARTTVAPQSISFSADTLFDFDKSALKPEGKTSLDAFARQLGGVQYDAIFVIGHTDRFGNNEYNQKLSERRAYAVKEYLASKDISANRIRTEGRGETQPVTLPGNCQGARSVTVVACLQPDRRVHVEVAGVKNPALSAR